MPDSCVSKEVSYNLSTNLQVILSPFPAMKLILTKKETKNLS